MDVALDNSVLSELCRDSDTEERFCAKVVSAGARVVVPVIALAELLTQDHERRVFERKESLLRLFSKADVLVGATVDSMLALEKKRRRPPKRSTGLADADLVPLLELLHSPNFIEEHRRLLPSLTAYMAKQHTHGLDRANREKSRELLPEAESSDLDRLLSAPIGFLMRDAHPFPVYADSRRIRDRVRYRPSDFPALVTLAFYQWLDMLGATFADLGFGSWTHLLRAPNKKAKGTWVDGRTAAASAHADVFLTNDHLQRNRVTWIAAAFRLRAKARGLSDFLDTP